ncbi:cell envelope integrity protein TolA [Ralstonia solanacearum P673]|uniref:cell envelope integrity protein TolA n=1 Tax=Ralstonia solanacearum TaxID=305 RepID=UPI000451435B|nr:cell envelope integrity protein TolA [Ralstonia solanacearum]EUJ14045.1 TonB-denpendent receptor [Ralstonia solanacearum P673]MCL9848343.1 cell envelope integrity protein TolA [Ralstonia solanacearum]MCL9853039.1 cell envelope integrity protein TolA [Ralstonia solanacearum]MCL9858489.1 cell envelope integrity protein TolA [Ralstonia solanacearum]MCL9863374.1 cell envelope integrity protein TolA [Ralstonia solanacearum]
MATTSLHRYEPVRERGTLRAFALAVLTHLLLLAFLYFGVQWQSRSPRGEEAELWDEAAVQALQSAPVPETKPEPVIQTPPAKVEEEADIALEQQKRKREQEAAAAAREAELARRAVQERAEAQRQVRLKEEQARQAELQRKALAEQQAKEKAAAEAQARKAAQLRAQAEAKAKAEAEAKLKAKAAADARLKAEAERKASEARSNAARQTQLAHLRAMAGAAGATGSVAGSGGGVGSGIGTGGTASPGYADRVRAKVKPNIVFDPEAVSGNPSAVVSVQMAPDGSILSRRLTKSSGNGAYDEAVLRAVDRSDPLPRDTSGKAPSSVILTFRPKE